MWMTLAVIVGHLFFWLGVMVGLILIPLGAPGAWVILGLALVYSAIEGFQVISLWGLLGLTGAAILGEVVEFFSGTLGAKYGGASKEGMLAATIGGIVGAILGTVMIPIPLIGSVLGAFALCFLLTAGIEYNRESNMRRSFKAGFGAFFGRIFSVIAKTAVGAGMAAWIAYKLYIA